MPRARKEPEEKQQRAPSEAESGGGACEVAARALRILVVDDADVNRELLRTVLESLGHSVAEAGGGAEAIEAALAERFDLIVMDIHMPEVDGMAATRAIRAREVGARTPIVALTADARPQRMVDCSAAGMDGFLTKPLSVTALLISLSELCQGGGRGHGHIHAAA